MTKTYDNGEVEALITLAGTRGFTTKDFADLCIAAADQAGMTVKSQEKLLILLPDDEEDVQTQTLSDGTKITTNAAARRMGSV